MKRSFLYLTLVCVSVLFIKTGHAKKAVANAPLSQFRNLPSDRPPDSLTRNNHYWISNETRLDLYYDSVKDQGGVYIGVGTDQNYLLAGWAKSELLVLMDFDRKIVDLHRAYEVAFRHAPNKEDFIALWQDGGTKSFQELIKRAHTEPKMQRAVLHAHRAARNVVARRFRKVRRMVKKANLPSFLTDDAQYSYIRGMFLDNKVYMVAGDLTATVTMKAIGKAIADAGKTVGILYLSNAEQYFSFLQAYKDNIQSLPSNKESLVLRTSSWTGLAYVESTEYHYNVQTVDSFKHVLSTGYPKTIKKMLKQATPGTTYGFSTLDAILTNSAEDIAKRTRLNGRSRVDVAKQIERRRLRKEQQEERNRLRSATNAERKQAQDERRAERTRARAEKRRLRALQREEQKRLRSEKRAASAKEA